MGCTEYLPCDVGTARSEMFYNEGAARYTSCKKCDEGTYQNKKNQPTCNPVPTGNKAIGDGELKMDLFR